MTLASPGGRAAQRTAPRADPRVGLCLLLLATLDARAVGAQATRPQEYQVKAAYLYSFGKFVEWPGGDGREFLICVLGEDPFGRVLDQVVTGGSVRGRQVAIRRVISVARSRECHVLFISASEDDRLNDVVNALKSTPVLTVGETSRFIERGGMIAFRISANRVRFAVNLPVAERAGLTLNSELLRVAIQVVRGQ